MSTQRSRSPRSGPDHARSSRDEAGGPRSAETTRRGYLAGVAAAAGTLTAVSGCVGSVGGGGRTGDGAAAERKGGGDGDDPVSVLAAGSLQRALSEGFRPAVDRTVRVEAHGSVTVARLVGEGKRDPDVVALADTALFDGPLATNWHAAFATNALVVAYDTDSAGGRRVGAADRWFDPVLSGEAALGRTDPDLDPLGYRTLFALELAADYYDRPDLRERLVAPRQVYPETSLLSRLDTGDLDAAVVYRSMAVDRGYDYVALPSAFDLSDPGRADAYADATYTLASGETVRGAPIRYGAVARRTDEAVAAAFDRLVAGDYLGDHGFAVPDGYPEYSGDVPRGVRP